jgi:Ca2+-binding EF-hand superfamily protein
VKHAKRFLDEIDNIRGRGNGDGQLSQKEFCEFLTDYTEKLSEEAFVAKIASWHANAAGSHRKLLLRRVFSRMDVDRSGSVSHEEFRALFSPLDGGEAAALFELIEGGGNSDGDLTSDEWVPFMLTQTEERSDDDFHAMIDEMHDVLARKRRETLLRQVFLMMDVDSSGTVGSRPPIELATRIPSAPPLCSCSACVPALAQTAPSSPTCRTARRTTRRG